MGRWSLYFLVIFSFGACVQKPTTADNTPSADFAPIAENTNAVDRSPSADREQPNTPEDQESLSKQCADGLAGAPNEIFFIYKAMQISYNPQLRIANWTRHEIYKDALERSCVKRSDRFLLEPRLKSAFHVPAVGAKDYSHTGYDRGHLAPSGDFQWGKDINDETFMMTNMTPQTPWLNQKAWNALEGRVRRWACGNTHLKVYTGPVIKPGLRRQAACVAVPEEFFKVVLTDQGDSYRAIGFIYSQSDSTDVWKERALPVAEVEKRTGLKFFTEFPEDIAQKFKSEVDVDAWEKSERECRACDGKPLQHEN
jgi:endonuclease G